MRPAAGAAGSAASALQQLEQLGRPEHARLRAQQVDSSSNIISNSSSAVPSSSSSVGLPLQAQRASQGAHDRVHMVYDNSSSSSVSVAAADRDAAQDEARQAAADHPAGKAGAKAKTRRKERHRPGKGKRMIYQKFESQVLSMIDSDPNFDVAQLALPPMVLESSTLKSSFFKKVNTHIDQAAQAAHGSSSGAQGSGAPASGPRNIVSL
mmetsp:Transcript_96542/g.273003  ORF Transcript_96542/g.273003 Transcript_96542/m.273003 type:complete len:209 (+) Transcript_96542:78-704(+)